MLIGTSSASGFKRKITIEDFEPVPCEYLQGPSYNLSENDRALLEQAMAMRRPGPDKPLVIVGFFRSHTRKDLFMDDSDLNLCANYFGEAGNVFLLIKPFATRPATGGFFFWEDGDIQRESSYLEFPFHRRELGGGESRPVQRRREPQPFGVEQTPAREEAYAPETYSSSTAAPGLSILSVSEPPPEPKKPSRLWRAMVPAFLVLAAIGGYFVWGNRLQTVTPQPPQPVSMPLKLAVADKQSQLEITWDRDSPMIARAERAVLYITDGSRKRDLELTAVQLHNGKVLYQRASADVGLRLEVFANERTSVSESIRALYSDPVKKAEPVKEAVKPPEVEDAPPPAEPTAAEEPPVKPAKKKGSRTSARGKRASEPKPESSESVVPEPTPAAPAPPPVTDPPVSTEREVARPARRR